LFNAGAPLYGSRERKLSVRKMGRSRTKGGSHA
jgi:hypothetical protein